MPDSKGTIALFVTCLVDLFRPNVGLAAVKLLEDRGYHVVVPESQTCCGQPALNSGDKATAQKLAQQVIAHFERYDHIILPSGSCAGTLIHHYPEIFAEDPTWLNRAKNLANKTRELISFLAQEIGEDVLEVRFEGSVTYHDSCAGLRELGIKQQPRALLEKVEGLTLIEMPENEVCCGFGGSFCVKYEEISNHMVTEKANNILESKADYLLAGDMGCLMNMAGKLRRMGANTKVRHIAEVLAGEDFSGPKAVPPIGQGEQ